MALSEHQVQVLTRVFNLLVNEVGFRPDILDVPFGELLRDCDDAAAITPTVTAQRFGLAAGSLVHMTGLQPTLTLQEELAIQAEWDVQDGLYLGDVSGFIAGVEATVALMLAHFQSTGAQDQEGAHQYQDTTAYDAIQAYQTIIEADLPVAIQAMADALAAHADATHDTTDPFIETTRAHNVHFMNDTVLAAFTLVADPELDPIAAHREVYEWFFVHQMQSAGPTPA